MKTIVTLIKKDITRLFADKPAMILTFIVPIVLILIFGNIFGGGGTRGKINILFVNDCDSKISKILEEKLDSSNTVKLLKRYRENQNSPYKAFDLETAKTFVKDGKYRAALYFPDTCFSDNSKGLTLHFYYDPANEMEMGLLKGTIQQTIMSEIPGLFPVLLNRQIKNSIGADKGDIFNDKMFSLVSEYFEIDKDTILKYSSTENNIEEFSKDSSQSGFMQDLINFESHQLVGTEKANPGVTRIVGGWAMMFLLFSITGAATSLFEEKEEGTLKRFLCMPVKRSHILWSKYIFSMLLGIFQLSVMFLFSWIIFDVDIFANIGNLMIVIIASSAAAVSFGMIITSMAKSLNQVNGIATLLILVMSALGGSWFPVSLLPDWMQFLSKFTITYWSVEAFLQVLWRNASFTMIAQHVSVLLSLAFIVNFYSLIRFRNGHFM